VAELLKTKKESNEKQLFFSTTAFFCGNMDSGFLLIWRNAKWK